MVPTVAYKLQQALLGLRISRLSLSPSFHACRAQKPEIRQPCSTSQILQCTNGIITSCPDVAFLADGHGSRYCKKLTHRPVSPEFNIRTYEEVHGRSWSRRAPLRMDRQLEEWLGSDMLIFVSPIYAIHDIVTSCYSVVQLTTTYDAQSVSGYGVLNVLFVSSANRTDCMKSKVACWVQLSSMIFHGGLASACVHQAQSIRCRMGTGHGGYRS
nr:hypothetical protein CFP56_30708 [Quercus suber]